MKVIGTAGHVDHGKSALVRRLTGTDPDRLEEEKRRGMTIDLGFAWLPLATCGGASVIDVPGHERFVRNMLAGAAGIDVVLLVVAADEGVMPQTREHLDIMTLLGVRTGVVAVTKLDLVEPDWLALVEEDVRSALYGTPLAGAPTVPVSAVTGQGIETLLKTLDGAVASAPARARGSQPYLPVDRVFSIAGRGTVVTGTLHGGELNAGGEVEILPAGRLARIRGMQSHGSETLAAVPGDRVAINLSGVDRADVDRGDVIAPPGHFRAVRRFDAELQVLQTAGSGLAHGTRLTLHIGAAERPALIAVLGGSDIKPGASGWVQVRTATPVVAIRGQRFVLRLPSPVGTVAGGEVVDIAPRHRTGDPRATRRLEGLTSPHLLEAVRAALAGARPRTARDLAAIVARSEDAVRDALEVLVRRGDLVELRGRFLPCDSWEATQRRAARLLTAFHAEHPFAQGMSREELRSRLHVAPALWPAALDRLAVNGVLRIDGATVALPTFRSTASANEIAQAVIDLLERRPATPPLGSEIRSETGAGRELLAALVREGTVVALDGDVYLLAGVFQRMVEETLSLVRERGTITVSEVRDLLGSNRRVTVALLERMDADRLTRRDGDRRVAVTASTCT